MVNMGFISQVLLLSLSIIALGSSIASCSSNGKTEIKSMTYILNKTFESGPGQVIKNHFFNVPMPKGHIGIKSFDAELVDEKGNSIPLHQTYLHHWFVSNYLENITLANNPKLRVTPNDGLIFKRNNGVCEGENLGHYWGLGADSRKTSSWIPCPFAVEAGSPFHVQQGFEEKWVMNIMTIDTRGVQDKKACTECRCDAYNISKEVLINTKGLDGKTLTTDYKGGIHCCIPEFPCKLKTKNIYKKRNITLRYKVKWVDWDIHQVPLRTYVLDVADKVVYNGSQAIHQCMVEFDVPKKVEGESLYHIKRAEIPMEQGGYLIYGTAHVHAGAVNATLYGEDGRVLCAVKAKKGKGKAPGNEKGYVVGMTVCYGKSGHVEIKKNESVTVEFVYKRGFRTGVMGHFYVSLADSIPHGLQDYSEPDEFESATYLPFNGQFGPGTYA